MAHYLASIYGTEKDKVNCSFYYKIGACRHGLKCTKLHNAPAYSQTVLLKNFYLGPSNQAGILDQKRYSNEELQQHFDDTYEELFVELELKYGELEELNVCENINEHLVGNTYCKFRYEEDAEKAVNDLNNRWFNGQPIYAELSPVTDFQEACCQFKPSDCPRGMICNFLHLRTISKGLKNKLFDSRRRNVNRSGRKRSWSRDRSRSRSRSRYSRRK